MNYFVDSFYGNDSNNGLSPETAFSSLARINKETLQGDSAVFLKCGSVWNEPLIPKRADDGKEILITSYSDGPRPVINGGGADNAVHLLNVSDVAVENLEVVNLTDDISKENRGIYISADIPGVYKNITVRNCFVHNISTKVSRTAGGIICWADEADAPISFDGVRIENCTVSDTEAQGITFSSAHSFRIGIDWTKIPYAASENIVIKNNYISRCGGDGIFQSCGNGAVIEHNTVGNCCYAGNTPYAGIWPHNSQKTEIKYNESFGNRLIAGDGQGYDVDIDCTDTEVTANYSHHNDGGFILICTSGDQGGYNNTVKVRNNICFEESGQIFTLSGPVKDIQLENNTVIVEKAEGTRLIGMYQWGESGGGPDGVTVKNNYLNMNTDGKNMFYPDSEYEFIGNTCCGSYDYSDIKDKTVKKEKRKYGFVYRSYGAIPHLSFLSYSEESDDNGGNS